MCVFCVFITVSLFVLGYLFCVYGISICYYLVVSSSAIDCLERLVSEMTSHVSSATLNPTHSLRKSSSKSSNHTAESTGVTSVRL